MNTKQGFIGIVIILIIAFMAGYYFAGHKDMIRFPDIIPNTASTTKVVSVYFTDTDKYAVGTEPYEVKVERKVSIQKDSKQAVIEELYKGPTLVEKQQHLSLVNSKTSGATLAFDGKTGVAKVYLQGTCDNNGASYTIYNLLWVNLRQFPDVKFLRVYDPQGNTLETKNPNSSSSPSCLQP